MAGPITELAVSARLSGRALARRMRGEIAMPPDMAGFRTGFETLLERLPEGVIRDRKWCEFAANVPSWIDSGMNLDAGREATYFICGRTTVVGGLDIWVDPRIQVWSKIGDSGAVTRATRESHSFVAPAAGPVLFGNYFPNHWADPGGRLGRSRLDRWRPVWTQHFQQRGGIEVVGQLDVGVLVNDAAADRPPVTGSARNGRVDCDR